MKVDVLRDAPGLMCPDDLEPLEDVRGAPVEADFPVQAARPLEGLRPFRA
jgi:hypothetical protein